MRSVRMDIRRFTAAPLRSNFNLGVVLTQIRGVQFFRKETNKTFLLPMAWVWHCGGYESFLEVEIR